MQQVSATVAAVVYPEAPVSLHSTVPATNVFPKAECQWFTWPEPWENSVALECVLELRRLRLLWLVTAQAAGLAHNRPLML